MKAERAVTVTMTLEEAKSVHNMLDGYAEDSIPDAGIDLFNLLDEFIDEEDD